MTTFEKEKLFKGIEDLVKTAQKLPEDDSIPALIKNYAKAVSEENIIKVMFISLNIIRVIQEKHEHFIVDSKLFDICYFAQALFNKYM